MRYDSVQNFRQECQEIFGTLARTGKMRFPNAEISHLRIRSETQIDYDAIKALASKLAKNMEDISSRDHNGREVTFVKLQNPLIDSYKNYALDYLEITAPKKDGSRFENGPDALVFADPHQKDSEETPASGSSSYKLRIQAKHARELMHA